MADEEKKPSQLEATVKVITVAVSIVALLWGGATFLITKQREARKAYLDYQLELYKETAKTAVILATSDDSVKVDSARIRFYELYYGELALVETREVAAQMVSFKASLEKALAEEDSLGAEAANLPLAALELAHVLRSSLAQSWGVEDWEF